MGTRYFCFCSSVPARWKWVAAQRRVRRDDDAQRPPNARQLLDRDRVRERVEPGTALLFGERDAEQAHRAKLGDDVRREATLLLVLVDLVDHLALEEVADGSAEQFVLGRKFEIHEESG